MSKKPKKQTETDPLQARLAAATKGEPLVKDADDLAAYIQESMDAKARLMKKLGMAPPA